MSFCVSPARPPAGTALALDTLLIVAVVLPYWRALGLPLTAP